MALAISIAQCTGSSARANRRETTVTRWNTNEFPAPSFLRNCSISNELVEFLDELPLLSDEEF